MGLGRLPEKLARRPIPVISGVSFALLIVLEWWLAEVWAGAMGYRGQLRMIALDMNLWPSQTSELLAAYGPVGRQAMALTHVTLDLLFPIAYSVLLLNVMLRAGGPVGLSTTSPLLFLPLAAGLADWLENAGFCVLALIFPDAPAAILWMTSFCTWAKFTLLALTLGIVLAWLWVGGGLPRTRRKRAAVVGASSLIALSLIGALFFGIDPDPTAPTLPAPQCSALLTIGLRGNGDALTQDQGMGADTRAVVDGVSGRLPASLDAAAISFPYVTGPWAQVVAHVEAGSRLLAAYVADINRRCPEERLVLVGQSEGAAVVHLALPFVGSQLVAAVLIADPARRAGASYDDLGSTNNGVLARLLLGGIGDAGGPISDVLPRSLQGAVHSYCIATDPVCDANWSTELQGMLNDVHTSYRHRLDVVNRAAEFVISRVVSDPHITGSTS